MANRPKPSFPQLNRSHPLAQGISFDAVLFEGGGNRVTDLVRQRIGTITSAAWIGSVLGRALSFAGGASGDMVDFGSFTPSTQRSLSFWFYLNSIDATSRRFLDTDNGSIANELINIDSANLLRYSHLTSGVVGSWQVPNPSVGALHNLFITFDASSVSNDPLIYLDAVPQTVTETSTPTGTFNSTAGYILGNRTSGGSNRALDGYIGMHTRWSRIFSQQEIQQYVADPFQIYKKKSLLAELSAAADPGLTAAYRTLMGVGA